MEVSDNPGAGLNSQGAAAQRRVSVFEQINLNVFWFANHFHWQALLAIVIPSMVVKFFGDANKDINLAMVVIGAHWWPSPSIRWWERSPTTPRSAWDAAAPS